MELIIFIIGVVGFAMAIIIHEVSHGLVAEQLGDPTARLMGRLTLNPLPHIDFLGSILIPITLLLMRSPFIFGWAKPVPIDPYNLKNPKKDLALISLAGPLSNLLFAVVLSIFLRVLLMFFSANNIFVLFFYLIGFNVALAVFNLIPINPLDGGKILTGILPKKLARTINLYTERFGMILIFLLIFPLFGGSSLVTIVIGPVVNFFLRILIPGYSLI